MTPYYDDGTATIYHGRCEDILPIIDTHSLLLTDPPYGLAEIMVGGRGHGWAKFQHEYAGGTWDVLPDLSLAISQTENAIVFGGNYFPLPPSRGWIVYVKPERGFTMADAELAWTSYDCPTRVVEGPRSFKGRTHPTQKPEVVMAFALRFAMNQSPIQTVIDPFMGSGTTLAVCKKNGIRCVGIDIHEPFCEMAAARLAQRSLFEDSKNARFYR